MAAVASVIAPDKPALAAKITAQLYSALAAQAGADKLKTAEVEFLIFLEQIGIKEAHVATQLWRFMAGIDAVDRLRRNPYVPASLMDWKAADLVGQRLLREAGAGGDLNSHPARLQGALNSVWRELLAQGDSAGTKARVIELLKTRCVDADETLRMADADGTLKRQGSLLRVPGAAWLEDQVTAALSLMEVHPPSLPVPTSAALVAAVYAAEVAAGLKLTDEQRSAVVTLLTLPVGALQGGAGVGKTTVMRVLATAWESMGGEVVLGALAGKAALTLSRGASSPNAPRLAFTIARLIGMLQRQLQDEGCHEHKRPSVEIKFTSKTLLVIDEAGMLDTPSLHTLLSLLPKGARLLLVGDEAQLPPVGIGKVFHDIVTDSVRVARLTKVLRQADDSEIPTFAALVREGRVQPLPQWAGDKKGVFLVAPTDLDQVQRRLRAEGELMVIAATKATVAAINETESAMSRKVSTPVCRLSPVARVAAGDPIVVTANRYQDALFNGLLGVVTTIDGPRVMVHWDGEREHRELHDEALGDIELAYAITCHKAQGSSSPAVIVVVENSGLVTREWLYTALTRARDLVLLVGDIEAIAKAVTRRTLRTTGFLIPALRDPTLHT